MRFTLLIAFFATGCFTTGHRSAKPLKPGKNEFKVGFQSWAMVSADETETVASPFPEVSFRRGVHEDVDIGARIAMFSAAVDAKIRVHRSEDFHVAVAPTAMIFEAPLGEDGLDAAGGEIPILLTREFDESAVLVGLGVGAGFDEPGRPSFATASGSIAVEFQGEQGFVRPGIEIRAFTESDFIDDDAVIGLVSLEFGLRDK